MTIKLHSRRFDLGLPWYWNVIISILYSAMMILPYDYLISVKKWPIQRFMLVGMCFALLQAELFLLFPINLTTFYLWLFRHLFFDEMNSFHTHRHTLEGIVSKLENIVNIPPYHNQIDLSSPDTPNYFSWESIYKPIKISKQKPTVIFIDYELVTNDPNISIRRKDNLQNYIYEYDGLLYIPEGCPTPRWLKGNIPFIIVTAVACFFDLRFLFEALFIDIDVKHFKVRKMLSSDPKAHKYNSITFAKEEVTIVEE